MTDELFDDQRVDLSDVVNAAVDQGVVVHGAVTLAIADIDLIKLDIGLLLAAVATVLREPGGPHGSLAAALPPPAFGPPSGATIPPPRAQELAASGADLSGIEGAGPHSDGSPSAEVAGDVRRGAREGTASTSQAEDPATAELSAIAAGLPERINADPDRVENGLARLVLTLIEMLRKVLEHQAIRRMDGGRLSDAEVERLGLALLQLSDRMRELQGVFGLSDEDLQIDLGPLGRLR